MRMKKNSINLKKIITKNLELPLDIIDRVSIVTIYGDKELWVENYKGLIEYTSEKIIIQGKNSRIKICGCELFIDYYANEELKIVGKICNVMCE